MRIKNFSNKILTPWSKNFTKKEQNRAWLATILLGIVSGGLVQLGTLGVKGIKILKNKKSTTAKVHASYLNQVSTEQLLINAKNHYKQFIKSSTEQHPDKYTKNKNELLQELAKNITGIYDELLKSHGTSKSKKHQELDKALRKILLEQGQNTYSIDAPRLLTSMSDHFKIISSFYMNSFTSHVSNKVIAENMRDYLESAERHLVSLRERNPNISSQVDEKIVIIRKLRDGYIEILNKNVPEKKLQKLYPFLFDVHSLIVLSKLISSEADHSKEHLKILKSF